MATLVSIPKLGMNMEEAVLVRWLVPEGATVKSGQPILEIETDKATVEVEAPQGGILGRVIHQEGETVPINTVVAVVVDPGEDVPADIPDLAV
jgi:pyruvate dehydrogenase E2 component (dihydrolipoamide acetyltransferase)